MLTNTEDKLSALRAINEEKEFVETSLSALAVFKNKPIETISLHTGDRTTFDFAAPPHIAAELIAMLENYNNHRRQQLIEKAEQLIKG